MAASISRLSDAIKNKMIAKYAWPEFEEAELQKMTDSIAEAIVEELAFITLKSASLDDTATTSSITTGIGVVDSGVVNGGIE